MHKPFLDYFGMKMWRSLFSRWRVRLQGNTSNAEIKRIFSLIHYAILVVAPVLALPNLLF